MSDSPTRLSLKLLRKEGWHVEVVERWNPHARIRNDLFGFADLIAIRDAHPPMLVQVTTSTNFQARRRKILAEQRALIWLHSSGTILLHGWKPKKKRGVPRECREEAITAEDFNFS